MHAPVVLGEGRQTLALREPAYKSFGGSPSCTVGNQFGIGTMSAGQKAPPVFVPMAHEREGNGFGGLDSHVEGEDLPKDDVVLSWVDGRELALELLQLLFLVQFQPCKCCGDWAPD